MLELVEAGGGISESAEVRLDGQRRGGRERAERCLLLEKRETGLWALGCRAPSLHGTATGASATDFERGLCEIDERLVDKSRSQLRDADVGSS